MVTLSSLQRQTEGVSVGMDDVDVEGLGVPVCEWVSGGEERGKRRTKTNQAPPRLYQTSPQIPHPHPTRVSGRGSGT